MVDKLRNRATATRKSIFPDVKDSKDTIFKDVGVQVDSDNAFNCNICFDQASSPVVTKCGHLYCYKCLISWFDVNYKLSCPVCKANSGYKQLIPIYTGDDRHDYDYKEELEEEFNNRNRPNQNPFFNAFPYAFGNGDQDFVFYVNGIPIHTSNQGGWLLFWGIVVLFFVIALPY